MPPPLNLEVARKEITFLHQVLGLSSSAVSTSHYKDAVFICVDCEAFEHDQRKVTELGVAVLDIKDLAGVKLRENGEDWVAKIQYAHYRPVEYARHVNRKFVKGAEDRFAFGDTTWINLIDASKVLTRIFQCPERLSDAANFKFELPDSKRNVIFVAHGVSNDDAYLNHLGFKLCRANNLVHQVDSQRVAGGTKKNNIGLKRLLDKLGIRYQGLHNGGNDAAYTLQAVLVMAVKEHLTPGLIFQPNDLPSMEYPGAVKMEGVSARHVSGGTAVEGMEKLPIDGGRPSRRGESIKGWRRVSAVGTAPNSRQAHSRIQSGRGMSTMSLPSLGRYAMKRPAPEEDEPKDQPARKK